MESKEGFVPMKNIQEQEAVAVADEAGESSLSQRGQGDGDVEACEPMSHEIQSTQRSADPPKHSGSQVNDQEPSPNVRRVQSFSDVHLNSVSSFEVPNIETSSQSSKQASCTKDSSKESQQKKQACNIVKNCIDKTKPTVNEPSTSGINVASSSKSETSSENKKRPSTLGLKRPADGEDSSSDTGNDDYSLGSEDGCIYTYRGGEHLADLPSSFFSLDMGLPLTPNAGVPVAPPPQANRPGSRASSPDMDFLEMDFDPGPSCEADTGDESTPEAEIEVASVPEANVIRGTSPEYQPPAQPTTSKPPIVSSSIDSSLYLPSTSSKIPDDIVKKVKVTCTEYITHVNVRGERLRVKRTTVSNIRPEPVTAHASSGDLVSSREVANYNEDKKDGGLVHKINQGENTSFDSINLTTALYHVNMVKKLVNDKPSSDETESSCKEPEPIPGPSQSEPCVEPPRCMVWSEREACERQVTQIGTSACGATAVVNVFLALGVPVNIERINAAVGTRLRANNAPIPRYIFSRSVAGCTAADIITGIQKASDGLVTARFFPTYPERSVALLHWLADWISLGAVPILTMNLQLGCEGEIPDAWHHQMVFGVSPKGVYLCNPVECVPESLVWTRLVSPSVLLVRSRDIIARFNPETDMSPLTAVPDPRFHKLNVLGQVVNVLREWRFLGCGEAEPRTQHVAVPASYQAGVTVAALTGSEAHRRLMHAPPLPAYL